MAALLLSLAALGQPVVAQSVAPVEECCQIARNSTRFFGGNGPLDEGVAATFRSGTYVAVVLSQDTLLYA